MWHGVGGCDVSVRCAVDDSGRNVVFVGIAAANDDDSDGDVKKWLESVIDTK